MERKGEGPILAQFRLRSLTMGGRSQTQSGQEEDRGDCVFSSVYAVQHPLASEWSHPQLRCIFAHQLVRSG